MNSGRDRFWYTIIGLTTVAVLAVVAILYLQPEASGNRDVSALIQQLPRLNAILNSLTSIALVLAYILIRRGHQTWHKRAMLTAFTLSAAFLVSYVIYHSVQTGPTHYSGNFPGLYFTLLISHIILAAAILPLALVTLFRGWTLQLKRHKRMARWTLPLWLYVSLTGIAVYVMLYT
jgi:putative membrane protein